MKLKEVKHEKSVRKDFSKVGDFIEMPNLIKVQRDSYDWFVEEGLGEVLKDISPIEDYTGNLILEFVDYSLDDKPKYDIEECKDRDATYCAPLKVKVRLINKETGEIIDEERGCEGFGYDAIFYYPPFNKTLAQMDMDEKNQISHRGVAIKEMINKLKEK